MIWPVWTSKNLLISAIILNRSQGVAAVGVNLIWTRSRQQHRCRKRKPVQISKKAQIHLPSFGAIIVPAKMLNHKITALGDCLAGGRRDNVHSETAQLP